MPKVYIEKKGIWVNFPDTMGEDQIRAGIGGILSGDVEIPKGSPEPQPVAREAPSVSPPEPSFFQKVGKALSGINLGTGEEALYDNKGSIEGFEDLTGIDLKRMAGSDIRAAQAMGADALKGLRQVAAAATQATYAAARSPFEWLLGGIEEATRPKVDRSGPMSAFTREQVEQDQAPDAGLINKVVSFPLRSLRGGEDMYAQMTELPDLAKQFISNTGSMLGALAYVGPSVGIGRQAWSMVPHKLARPFFRRLGAGLTAATVANKLDVTDEHFPETAALFMLFEGAPDTGAAAKRVGRAAYEKATRRTIEEEGAPREVFVSAEKVKDIFQTGEKISPEEGEMVRALGLKASQYKAAIDRGLHIRIPAEKIITYGDRPWVQVVKKAFGKDPYIEVRKVGEAPSFEYGPKIVKPRTVKEKPAEPPRQDIREVSPESKTAPEMPQDEIIQAAVPPVPETQQGVEGRGPTVSPAIGGRPLANEMFWEGNGAVHGVAMAPSGNYAIYKYHSPNKVGGRFGKGHKLVAAKFFDTQQEAAEALAEYAQEKGWNPLGLDEFSGRTKEAKTRSKSIRQDLRGKMMPPEMQLDGVIETGRGTISDEGINAIQAVRDRWVNEGKGPTPEEIHQYPFLEDVFKGQKPGKSDYVPPQELAGAARAIDQARISQRTSPGTARLAQHLLTLDPTFDQNSTLEISDAVHKATPDIIKREGLDPEGEYAILGKTVSHIEDAATRTAISLYKGHDADTLVEEWYHRAYDRLNPKDRAAYDAYHKKTGDTRSPNEHFAQEGRDFFFSDKLHEAAGGIRRIFEGAREALKALIKRVRDLRGAKIPKKIQEMYRRAGSPWRDAIKEAKGESPTSQRSLNPQAPGSADQLPRNASTIYNKPEGTNVKPQYQLRKIKHKVRINERKQDVRVFEVSIQPKVLAKMEDSPAPRTIGSLKEARMVNANPERVKDWEKIYASADEMNVWGDVKKENKEGKLKGIAVVSLTKGCQRALATVERVANGVLPNETRVEACFGGDCWVNKQFNRQFSTFENMEVRDLKLATKGKIAGWLANPTVQKWLNSSQFIRQGQQGCDSHLFASGLAKEWLDGCRKNNIKPKTIFISAGYAPVTKAQYEALKPYADLFEVHFSVSGWFHPNELMIRLGEFQAAKDAGLPASLRVVTNKDNIDGIEMPNQDFLFQKMEEMGVTQGEILETPFHDDSIKVGQKRSDPTGEFLNECCATGNCRTCGVKCMVCGSGAGELFRAGETTTSYQIRKDPFTSFYEEKERKYADILDLPPATADHPVLDMIEEGTATADHVKQYLSGFKGAARAKAAKNVQSVIADRIGDMVETYRYESTEDGQALESYIDRLLKATGRVSQAEMQGEPGASAQAKAQPPGKISQTGRVESYQLRKSESPWYSQLERVVESPKFPNRAPGAQMAQALESWAKTGEIKQEELDWSGVTDWLKSQGPKVTKAEVLDYLRQNNVQIQEVMKGEDIQELPKEWEVIRDKIVETGEPFWSVVTETGETYEMGKTREQAIENALKSLNRHSEGRTETRYSSYQLPGGENYREMLLALPEVKESVQVGEAEPIGKEYGNKEFMGMWEGRYPIMGVKSYPFSIGNQNGRITYWPWTVRPNGDRGVEKYIVDSPNMQNAGFASMEAARAAIEESYNESGYMQRARTDQYRSSHWEEPNVLAHVRFNDRVDADGKRVLFLEEVQSDWHQAGRQEGYKSNQKVTYEIEKQGGDTHPDRGSYAVTYYDDQGVRLGWDGGYRTEESARIAAEERKGLRAKGVPDAPFKKTWPMLAFKRMVRYAAENGYDRIAWTTGEQQAARYDLSKQISEVTYHDKNTGGIADAELYGEPTSGTLRAYGLDGRKVIEQYIDDPSKIADYIGKEAANKLLEQKPSKAREAGFGFRKRSISGLDLKVGGEGMKGFYDKILPSEVNKFFGKGKWGNAKVSSVNIGKKDRSGPAFPNISSADKYSGFPLNPMYRGMSAATENDKVAKAVIEAIPANVMQLFREESINAKDLIRDPSMFLDRLSIKNRLSITDGIGRALSEVGALLRTGLDSAYQRGFDKKLLPALRASDLDTNVAAWMLYPKQFEIFQGSLGVSDNMGLGRAGLRAEPGTTLTGTERSPAELTDFVEWHKRIVHESGGDVKQFLAWGFDITPEMKQKALSEGMPYYQARKINKDQADLDAGARDARRVADQQLGKKPQDIDKGFFEGITDLKPIRDLLHELGIKDKYDGLTLTNKDYVDAYKYLQMPADVKISHPEFGPLYDRQRERELSKAILDHAFAKKTEPYFKGMDDADRIKVDAALIQGEQEGVSFYDPLQLKERFGLNEKQIAGYTAIRDSLDAAGEMLLWEMEQSGVKPEALEEFKTRLAGYVPHKWYGNWAIIVRKKGGKKTKFMTKTNFLDRYTERDRVQALYPNDEVFVMQSKKIPYEAYQDAAPWAVSKMVDLVIDKAEVSPAMADELKQALGDLYKSKGFGAHFIKRKGTPGWTEDLAKPLAEYFAGLNGYMTKMRAIKGFAEDIQAIDPKKKPNLYRYALDYIRYVTGEPFEFAGAKQAAYIYYLYANIKSAAVNLTQNMLLGWPVLAKHTRLAGAKLLQAQARAANRHMLTDGEKAFLEEMESLGYLDPKMAVEMGAFTANPLLRQIPQGVKDFGEFIDIFQHMEAWNRRAMAVALYDSGIREPMRAAELIEEAHFRYSKGNRPDLMRGIISPIMTFRSWMINYVTWLKNEIKAGRLAPVARSLAAMVLLGGFAGLPFFKLLKKLWVKVFGEDPQTAAAKHIGKSWATLIFRGLPSKLGISFTGSIGLGDILPTDLKSLGGVFADIPGRIARVIKDLSSRDYVRALEDASPEAIRQPMAAYRSATEGDTTRSGAPIFDPTTGEQQRLTAGEAATKSLGFQPMRSAERWDLQETVQQIQDARTARKQEWANRYVVAMRAGNKKEVARVVREINDYNKRMKAAGRPDDMITKAEVLSAIQSRKKAGVPPKYMRPKWKRLLEGRGMMPSQ